MFIDDPSPTLRVIYAAWFAAMGGAIGSFLNVVAYRVPSGMGLVSPGSHCPFCGHSIRWHDNVPVLGWIQLRGQCRDCGARIPIRYPLVEAITAVVFLILGWVEILSGGANLPARPVDVIGGVIYPTLQSGEVLGIGVYHLLLLCTLLVAALIEWDGHELPTRVVMPALVVGLAAPMVWPFLHPTPAWRGMDGWLAGWVDGAAGLAAGLAIGGLFGRAEIAWRRRGTFWSAGCVGVFLGYQAVLLMALPLGAIVLFQALCRRTRPAWPAVPSAAWLAAFAFAWLLAWKLLATL